MMKHLYHNKSKLFGQKRLILFALLIVLMTISSSTADSSANLQYMIDELPVEGGTIILNDSTYIINDSIYISNKENIHLLGSEKTTFEVGDTTKFSKFIEVDSMAAVIMVHNSYNITISNIQIYSTVVPTSSSAKGIIFNNVTNSKISNVNIRNLDRGVVFLRNNLYNIIEHSVFSKNRANIMFSGYGGANNYNNIHSNFIEEATSYLGFELNSDNDYNLIENNTFSNNVNYGFSVYSGSSNNIFYNNDVYGNKYGIRIMAPKNTFKNNNIYKNAGDGVLVLGPYNLDNLLFSNNNISYNKGNGVKFSYDLGQTGENIVFETNDIYNNSLNGIYLDVGNINILTRGNYICNNGGYGLIQLSGNIVSNEDYFLNNLLGASSMVESKVDSSGTGLSFTPTAPTFESAVGDSTNFVVSSDQTFTSSTWYFNDEEVASGATTYTHNWNTAGTHEVRFDGTAAAGTISRTWTVTVPEPANTGVSSVSIAPSSTVVAPGESFSLDVYIDPGQPLSGSQFNMHYSSIVTASSVQDCGLFSVDGLSSTFNNGEIDNVNSAITGVYSAIVGSGAVSEACAMATVNMVAGSTSGIVDFTLSNLVLSDANSAPAPYDVSYATVLVDTAPQFNALSPVTADETDSISFTITATDAEGDDLIYSATSLPGSATFDPNTASFTWTPDVGDAGTYTASFAVTDGYLNDSVSVTITVEELNNAPVITLFEPADGTEFEEGSIVDINVAGTDSDGQNLNYVIKINGDIVSTGQSYSWVTDYSSAGTHTITAIVSDGIDDVSSTHGITISDLHPRWDVNEDGNVNVLDITLVGQNYGLAYASELPRWDVNQDGTINVQDLSIVSGHFGETV